MRYTPSPWVAANFVDAGLGREVRGADGGPVCRVDGSSVWSGSKGSGHRTFMDREANTLLIAAAPDLLEALEAAVASIAALRSYIERHADELNDEAHLHLGNSEVRIRDGLAAVAKARGAS